MPGNRVRVAADWLLTALPPRQAVRLGPVRPVSVPPDTASPEAARFPAAAPHPTDDRHDPHARESSHHRANHREDPHDQQ